MGLRPLPRSLIFSIFPTGPGQRFTRVYLTHLQHEADKIHIAFVFGSSPELLMESQMGQGPTAAARPSWSPLRCWQLAALSALQSSWVRVTESGKGPSGRLLQGVGCSLTCGEGGCQDEGCLERRGGGEDSGGAASSSGRECFVSTDCMFSLHLYP